MGVCSVKYLIWGCVGLLVGVGIARYLSDSAAPRRSATESLDATITAKHPARGDAATLVNTAETSLTAATQAASIEHYSLTAETLSLFDSIISESQSKASPTLINTLAQHLRSAGYSERIIEWLTDLFARYIAYKSQLGAVKTADTEQLFSADHMLDTLTAVEALRTEYFTAEEIVALFAMGDEYDQMALARLRIQQDTDLTALQKQQLLAENIAQLPQQFRDSFAPSLAIRKLQNIKRESQALAAEHRFALLSAEYGDAAAQRIAHALDAEILWRNRVERYRATVEQLRADNALTKAQIMEKIAHLKASSFSDNERRRLDVFLRNPQLLQD